jgi:hypothetical protein
MKGNSTSTTAFTKNLFPKLYYYLVYEAVHIYKGSSMLLTVFHPEKWTQHDPLNSRNTYTRPHYVTYQVIVKFLVTAVRC